MSDADDTKKYEENEWFLEGMQVPYFLSRKKPQVFTPITWHRVLEVQTFISTII